jgi:hypothetical protein
MSLLSAEELLNRWGSLGQVEEAPAAAGASSPVSPQPHYRYFKPLLGAADGVVRDAQDTRRINLGIPVFDNEMRGIGRGHLCVMVGYSHSGKTLVAMHAIRHNRDKRIAMFIPDEPAELVLTKLAALTSGVPAKVLEARIAANDAEAIELLRRTATEEFPNLAVFDQPLTPDVMETGWNELSDHWGDEPELVILDYVDLLEAGETVPTKLQFIKSYAMRHKVPFIALHQTSRSAGAEGRVMTIDSGAFGGEQPATYLLGVRRKVSALYAEYAKEKQDWERKGSAAAQDRMRELEYDMEIHKYTVSVNLLKNKRPGGGKVEREIDFELFVETGQIVQLGETDMPRQFLAERRY